MGEQSYSIYEPERTGHNVMRRADELVFVRDGFSWPAMLVPVLWLIYHRLWLPLAGFLGALVAVQGIGWLAGITSEAGSGLLSAGVSIAFGFLAADIRRWVLERRNHRLVGTVTGDSEAECERRFFDDWPPLRAAKEEGGR